MLMGNRDALEVAQAHALSYGRFVARGTAVTPRGRSAGAVGTHLPRTSGGLFIDREELGAVFYGTGKVPFPWATDCPVRFDAWLGFAQPIKKRGERVDLILGINEEHGVRRVLDQRRQLGNSSITRPTAAFINAAIARSHSCTDAASAAGR
jgi:hypothetical protein